ncbi:uncharacterized protein LOC121372721 [Gigantopelta aegis]|uniref:uncharacterized protein LOC121372721 n=1 Tax=Gigantopelta aegis TaxID=1735272 RepID=UPI001B88DB50|nr:uncharacterized protein LOC121372721 [Gigantopelta aegis]
METAYKCDISTSDGNEEVGQSVDSTAANDATSHFMSQDMSTALGSSAAVQSADVINKSSDTRSKLLDSIMTAPTLFWTSTMPKGLCDSGARSHVPTGYIQIEDLHAMAQASLIAQTQEIISKQLESEAVQHRTKVKAQPIKIYSNGIKSYTKVLSSSSSPKKFHDASQSSVRSLRCPYKDCNRTFSWPAHLKYHQLTHTGEKNYACDHDGCGKSFYTKQRLLVHSRTHTGVKPFVCTDPNCEKSFTTAQNLANHQRIHTGERPYACDYDGCTRRFAEISSLRKHSLTHTGKKPFPCNICGKTFTQSGSRMVHWKRHQLNKSTSRNQNVNNCQKATVESGILVLQAGVDNISRYQDIQGSDSVVFSQSLSDNVVTVSTGSSEVDSNHIQLSQELLPSQVMNSGSHQTNDFESQHKAVSFVSQHKGVNFVSQHEGVKFVSQHKGVNFVVLSQPQEVINLSSALQQKSDHGGPTKEIVFKNELLISDLDHEEIAQSEFSLQALTSSEDGKEILTDSHLVPQEVSEVIVGDCIHSEERESETSDTDGLMSHTDREMNGDDLMCHTDRQISADGLLSHRDNEMSGDNIVSHAESEITVGDCITLEGERDSGRSLMPQEEGETCVSNSFTSGGDRDISIRDKMSQRDSEMCVRDNVMSQGDSEMSVRDSLISQREREMCVSDSLMSHRESEMCVSDSLMSHRESEMCVRDSLMSHRESEMCVRDSLMSHRESEMCVRDSLMSHRESEMCVRDSLISHRESEMCVRESEMCVRDSLMSHRESEMCVRDSLMSHRESEMCVRDSLMSQEMREICVEDGILAQSVMNSQQSLSEHGNLSSSSQSGKEMVMDPMMESDEEGEMAVPTGIHGKNGHLT